MVQPMNDKAKNNRRNLTPETLQDLQASLYDWQNYNFGPQDNERMLLGIAEEAGELCHSYLKMEQGIRGSADAHNDAMRDAVGDIMIYTLNFMSGQKWKIQNFVPREDVEVSSDHKIVRPSVLSVFRTAGRIAEEPNNPSRVQHMISSLIYLCALKGWDLEEVLRDTWFEVGQRDWRNFPERGFPPGQEPRPRNQAAVQPQVEAQGQPAPQSTSPSVG